MAPPTAQTSLQTTARQLRRRRQRAVAALWEGWRGLMRLVVVGLLAFAAGELLDHWVETVWVQPICQAHAANQGLAYRGIVVERLRSSEPGSHCLFGKAGQYESSLPLQKVMGFLPSLWIDFATGTEITVPLLACAFASLWSAWRIRSAALSDVP